eukprot:7959100-Pyramimonas_sp.AAC.1
MRQTASVTAYSIAGYRRTRVRFGPDCVRNALCHDRVSSCQRSVSIAALSLSLPVAQRVGYIPPPMADGNSYVKLDGADQGWKIAYQGLNARLLKALKP